MDRMQGDCASPVPSGDAEKSRTGEEDPGPTVLGKAHEFFQICDVEGKGFITCQDMQRLYPELPLSLEELEKVFVMLDADGNGSLTPKEFTTGFSQFLLGQIALNKEMQQSEAETACLPKSKETVRDDDDEEFQFSNLMDRLGAKKVLEDESDVKQLWLQLRKDESHLLSSFEEFLARIFSQLQDADNEKNELEWALKKKTAAFDEEIQNLYEEMEQQIKKEKEEFLLKDTERFQSYSQELECKLLLKEQELEQLVQNQKRLEQQCTELLSGKQETKVENTKLKLTNQELLDDLVRTSHDLHLAQQQLQVLQEEASRLHEEKEMEVYRVTETLEREKSGLLKQLDFLRERNKHLKDERDIFLQQCKTSARKASWKQRTGSVIGKYIEGNVLPNSYSFEDDVFNNSSKRMNSAGLNGFPSVEPDAGATGGMSKASHLQRIISIEEDHLPQLLDKSFDKQLSKQTEDESTSFEMELDKKNTEPSMEHSPPSSRGQPAGKEALSNEEGIKSVPDRLFKIIFVGNSSVGKTSFLRRFCEDRFFPGTAATIGVDYSVKTITVDNTQVALQLWDTAGQERYRSITKQFFRKADGVIVMYDITAKDTFTAVKQWLISIEEGTGENVPVLLLGNKTDNEKEREVPNGMGEHLAKDYNLIFYECSAYSGHNTKKSVLHLARILKEHEDKMKEKTIELQPDVNKKSCCIRP
uniref:Calcium release activated channel regulator 2A n=1 Tax=Anser cygnoides TaxID=8845 RepID=A0A8B9IGX5_ANSCY|nr:EF-hand calcium-binding domain-containing protein 4B isoform X1 [Anser cygnoides]XP_013055395.2 EF-hand calcium-binding domain-containing protein 4B isoform X1 [Anser cygnoides]XP_013055396.2 EF-hand calcium-binding domain-containing protein 4B isoform X1 [Anser cygnoides]XP_013055399.2 EF-hand calcium-binding domain-containing protein 4B isoform X1 [Anser cygnoides]XP_047908918.1 EF-hand calcium-binding domain-containing protein 4B isoform X1 [Anser cygnoides]